MTSLQSFAVGPITITIRGDGVVARQIQSEFSLAEVPQGSPVADLVVDIGGASQGLGNVISIAQSSRFPYRSEILLCEQGTSFSLTVKPGIRLYTMDLSGFPLGPTCVTANVGTPFLDDALLVRLLSVLTRVGTRDFATLAEVVAKNIIYEIIDPLVWCRLLANDATLVHAGAVADTAGRGVLLLGTGGVGKTTTVLELVQSGYWRYLADDFVVLSRNGLSQYPKRLQLYAYNSKLVPGVQERLLVGRSMIDRAAWHARRRLLGLRQARRRVHASDYFGSSSQASSASVAAAVNLVSAPNSATVRVERVDRAELAEKASSVIINEFWEFSRLLNAMATLTSQTPTLSELQQRVRGLIEVSLPEDFCCQAYVPPGTPGATLSEALRSQLEFV